MWIKRCGWFDLDVDSAHHEDMPLPTELFGTPAPEETSTFPDTQDLSADQVIEVVDATPQRHEVGSGKPAADLGSVPLAGEEGVTGKQPVVAPSHEVESLLQVAQADAEALAKASVEQAVPPSVPPPAKLTRSAIRKRLWRVCQPKANGKLKVPKEVVEEYRDESSRQRVEMLFEKSGYQRDIRLKLEVLVW